MAIAFPCACGFAEVSEEVLMCECHIYRRMGKPLESVTQILKAVWPFPADYSDAQPEVLENARDRGIEVDALFSAYVNGTLPDPLPPGVWRKDAVALFLMAKDWWDSKGFEGRAQVIVANSRSAGTFDAGTTHDWVFDLKATSKIEPKYPVQLGGYASMFFEQYKRPVKGLGILWVTKRFKEAKFIMVDRATAIRDWTLIQDCYYMAKERQGGKS